MSNIILTIVAIVIGLDTISNLFLLMFAPRWEEAKRSEIIALKASLEIIKQQNAELRNFIREMQLRN